MSQLALSLFTNPPTVHTVKFQYSVGLFSLQAVIFFCKNLLSLILTQEVQGTVRSISKLKRFSSIESDYL